MRLGRSLLHEMEEAKNLYQLLEIGERILKLEIEDELYRLILTWRKRWQHLSLGGLTDTKEEELFGSVLADLRQQEEASRARVAAVREDARKCMAEVERLLDLNNVGRGH